MQSHNPQVGLEKSPFRKVWFPYLWWCWEWTVEKSETRGLNDAAPRFYPKHKQTFKSHWSLNKTNKAVDTVTAAAERWIGSWKWGCAALPHRTTQILTQWGILIAFTSSSGAAWSPDNGWCVLTGRWTSRVVAGHVRASGGVLHSSITTRVIMWGTCVCIHTQLEQKLQLIRRKDLDQQSNQENK